MFLSPYNYNWLINWPLGCLKILHTTWNSRYIVGFRRFLGHWLRARLCCRKLSDSIFWLYYFTPRWLAGAMPCSKKVHKKYTKGKDKKQIRNENISFILSFIYSVNGLTNQRYVPKHSVVSKTPDSKIGVVGSTSLPEKRSVHRKPEYLSLFTGSKFATPKSF